jgi:hypothetical protein
MATRTIRDPGPQTLPKRRSDRVLEFAIILTVLGALFIFAAGIFAASVPKTTVSGGSTPTEPNAVYRECQFCQRLYVGKPNAERTQFVFDNHMFFRLPVSPTVIFITCEWQWGHHIVEALEKLRQVGGGQFVEISKVNK